MIIDSDAYNGNHALPLYPKLVLNLDARCKPQGGGFGRTDAKLESEKEPIAIKKPFHVVTRAESAFFVR